MGMVSTTNKIIVEVPHRISGFFEIVDKEKGIPIVYYIILGILILVAIVSTIYFIRRIRNEKKKDS